MKSLNHKLIDVYSPFHYVISMLCVFIIAEAIGAQILDDLNSQRSVLNRARDRV